MGDYEFRIVHFCCFCFFYVEELVRNNSKPPGNQEGRLHLLRCIDKEGVLEISNAGFPKDESIFCLPRIGC